MTESSSQRERVAYDVAVLGAGMAGLTAARSLAEAGLRVLLLEARDRVGGRIYTVRDGDTAVELGAEFVHGQPPELLALIEEAGLTLAERDGAMVSADDGQLLMKDEQADDSQERDPESESAEPLEHLRALVASACACDQSFAAWLEAQRGLDPYVCESATDYVEGFNAADAREISIKALGVQQGAEDAIGGDRVFHIQGGYDQLTDYQAGRVKIAGASLRLRSPVDAIDWQPGRVTLRIGDERVIAERAVITLPLSLLQRNLPRIQPEPADVVRAALQMRMGTVCRFTLLFHEAFWRSLPHAPELCDLSFLLAFQAMLPVWWTALPEPEATLTGWVGGPRALALLSKSPAELATDACRTLAGLMQVPETTVQEQLRAIHTHDWQADPFSAGSYSYVASGGLEASRRMSEPVAGTLFFAGEHTDTTGHWGTVHGAMRSGLRAAAQVLASCSTER